MQDSANPAVAPRQGRTQGAGRLLFARTTISQEAVESGRGQECAPPFFLTLVDEGWDRQPASQFWWEERGDHHPETDIVVPVVWVVPVAVGAAGVVLIVVPGAAPQHPVVELGASLSQAVTRKVSG